MRSVNGWRYARNSDILSLLPDEPILAAKFHFRTLPVCSTCLTREMTVAPRGRLEIRRCGILPASMPGLKHGAAMTPSDPALIVISICQQERSSSARLAHPAI